MVRIEIHLPPEEAAVVWEAVASAMDQASAEAQPVPNENSEDLQKRRADAIVDVARAYSWRRAQTAWADICATARPYRYRSPG
jgi:hypothetical protein